MPHKQMLFRSAAREKILRGAAALADAVRVTLGPQSKCVDRKEMGQAAGLQCMKILLALDGSSGSDAAIQQVLNRPWPAGSQVKILFRQANSPLAAILNWEAEGDIFPFSFFLFPSCPGGFPPQHEKPRLKMKNSNSD
jgi:hypothetical protein